MQQEENKENVNSGELTQKDRFDYLFEAWKQSIDVQKHFNDLSLKVRNFLITLLGGILTVSIIIYDSGNIKASYIIFIFAICVLVAMYVMDRYWYHRLLKGAVVQGTEMEKELGKMIPEIALTQKISKVSQVETGVGKWILKSNSKMAVFYGLLLLACVIILLALPWYNNPTDEGSPEPVPSVQVLIEQEKDSIINAKINLLEIKIDSLIQMLATSREPGS